MIGKGDFAQFLITAKDETEQGVASAENRMGRLLASVGRVSAGLAALGGTAIAAAVLSQAQALDKLNDAADATGASIENLSALESIARRNGSSLDAVTDSIIKLNMALSSAPDSDAAKALKAIGLSVEELRKLDPAEAYQRVAVALNGYADDGNKARLVQELLGRSLKELAPLLKDTAEAGKLNATVTTEQAAAAEKLNKSWSIAVANITDMARGLTTWLIPALNEAIERFNVAAKAGDGFLRSAWEAVGGGNMRGDMKNPWESLNSVNADIDRIKSGKGGGNAAFNERRLVELERRAKYLQAYVDDVDAKLASGADYKPTINFNPAGDKAGAANAKKAADEAIKRANESSAAWVKFIDEQIAAERQLAEIQASQADARYKEIQQYKDLADPLAKYTAELEKLARIRAQVVSGERSDISVEQIDKATEAIKRQGSEANKTKSFTEELGLVFQSNAETAVADIERMGNAWEYLRGILQGVLQDILKLMTRKAITEPLMKGLDGFNPFATETAQSFMPSVPDGSSSVDLGGSIDDFLAGFRADGGPVSAGKRYVVGERGPELFVPSAAGTIVPNHAMGGLAEVNIFNYEGAPVTKQQRMTPRGPALDVMIGQAVGDQMSRPGTPASKALDQRGARAPLVQR